MRAVAIGVAALSISACGGSDDDDTASQATTERPADDTLAAADIDVVVSDADPRRGGRLVYGLSAETDGWNPTLSRWAPSGVQVAQAIFDFVVVVDAEGRWHPNVVESLEANDEFTRWVFTMRDGVTFHNGRPLDAEALRAHLQFIADSPLSEMIMEPVESIEAQGNTVVVSMTTPWATFPYVLTTQVGAVAEPEWLATGAPDNPVGTGPFVHQSWVPDQSLVATRNPDYWREGFPYLEEIEFQPIADGGARSRALRDGEVHIIQVTEPVELRAWRDEAASGPFQYLDSHEMEMPESLVMLNMAEPPFDDPDARRALVLATDREAFLDNIGATDLFIPAAGPWAPDSPWYSEIDHPGHDPEAARELVDAVIERHGSFSFTIDTVPTADSQAANQALIDAWTEVGIDVSLTTQPQAALIPKILFGNYQAAFWRQFDYAHPSIEAMWWNPRASGGEWYPFEYDTPEPPGYGLNLARVRDAELEQLIDDTRGLDDPTAQREQFRSVSERLNELMPYVWLYHTRDAVVARDDVVNIAEWTTPAGEPGIRFTQGTHPVAQIWLER